MSRTSPFKYLESAQPKAPSNDAAQSFLDDKLSKNKYTIKQQERLDASGGSSVETEDQYNTVISNQKEIDDFKSNASLGGKGDLRDRYKAAYGSWAGDDLASSNDAASANAIYDKIKALESDDYWASQDLGGLMKKVGHQEHIVNIGNFTKDGGLAVDATIANGINFDNIQGQLDEKGWNGEKNNSISQLGSALLAADGTGGSDGDQAPKPIEKQVKIEHSPEIKQAKERVANYENDLLSGKMSDDIYSNGDYSFDATKGAAGIGATKNNSSNSQSETAAASFLDKKKFDIKANRQFQPT